MTTIIDWPEGLFAFDWRHPALQPAQVIGGESMTGAVQVTIAPTWRWRVGLGVHVATPASTRAAQVFFAMLDGALSVVRLPVYIGFCALPAWWGDYPDGVPYSGPAGDALHSSGAGLASPRGYEVALGGVAAGATTVDLPAATLSGCFYPGHHVTINEDLHIVTAVSETPAGPRLSIRPPTRRAHAVGTKFYSRATGIFRLASSDIPALQQAYGRFGQMNFDFVEAWERV